MLPNFDYACTIWGSVNANTKCIQRLQNRAARIICNNFDIINYRGIDLVRELQWLSISQRINYFLCVLVFNCIHGNAPRYLSDSNVVHACIVVVLFNQGLVEKQLFITDERVTLNKYISNNNPGGYFDKMARKCSYHRLRLCGTYVVAAWYPVSRQRAVSHTDNPIFGFHHVYYDHRLSGMPRDNDVDLIMRKY